MRLQGKFNGSGDVASSEAQGLSSRLGETKASRNWSPSFQGHVLLVDDSRENLRVLSYYLRRYGLTVEVAENGLEAAEKGSSSHFDLILMDLQMPILDGYAAASLLRQRGNQDPIIALTAQTIPDDIEKCLSAGCDDFLHKPIDFENFVEMLARYLPYRSGSHTDTDQDVDGGVDPNVDSEDELNDPTTQSVSSFSDWTIAIGNAIRIQDFAEVSRLVRQLHQFSEIHDHPRIEEIACRIERAARTIESETAELHALILNLESFAQREPFLLETAECEAAERYED